MDRFRPRLETVEDRVTPTISGVEAQFAMEFVRAGNEELQTIWDHAGDPKTTLVLEYHRTYLQQVHIVSNVMAANLGEYAVALNAAGAGNPAFAPHVQSVLDAKHMAEVNAVYAASFAIGFGVPASTYTPVPPASPQPPAPPAIDPLDPTNADGVSRTIPDLTASEWRETDSGLRIWDVIEGEGEPAAAGGTATVHYIGWLTNGTVFDSSIDSGDRPFDADLSGGVIQGWIEGIPGLKPGGLRRLDIPAELAYGSQQRGNIPANSRLIFEIKGLTPGTDTPVP
ncbi:MAG TPA: FKBP-type peptidyl-prolyl cis-trans isomerase [Gemmataceae bacterium]|nr:FKBP-type peptidyl-prolyl cis-trans isomerase [Gemmataceae bacterium]